jgi:hypothetical protein
MSTIPYFSKHKKAVRILGALLLAVLVGFLLWLTGPFKPVRVEISEVSGSILGEEIGFAISVANDDAEDHSIASIAMYIYSKEYPGEYSVTCENLSLDGGGKQEYDYRDRPCSGGKIIIDTVVRTAWGYGYGYGDPGGYRGYGYGPGPVKVDYDIIWESPEDWPSGDYIIRMVVTTADNQEHTDTLSVNLVQAPGSSDNDDQSRFTVRLLEVVPAEVAASEPVEISVVVRNNGEAAGTYDVSLRLDGEIFDSKPITLTGGEEGTLTFTVNAHETKNHTVSVDGLSADFRVAATAATPAPAAQPSSGDLCLNWWLIGIIVAILVTIAVIIWLTVFRERKHTW